MAEKIKNGYDESLFATLFKPSGFLGRLGFWGTMLFISSVLAFLLKQNNMFLTFLGYLFALYSGTMAIQKRCRDIGSNGTIVLLIYSAFVVFKSCLD